MSVTILLTCGGCGRETRGTDMIRRRFVSFSGKSHGFGRYVTDPIERVVPEGWHAFDPYTQVSYCPECWDSIVHEIEGGEVQV